MNFSQSLIMISVFLSFMLTFEYCFSVRYFFIFIIILISYMRSLSLQLLLTIILILVLLGLIFYRFLSRMRTSIVFIDYICAQDYLFVIGILSFLITIFEFISSFFIIYLSIIVKYSHDRAYFSRALLLSLSFINLNYFFQCSVILIEFGSWQPSHSFHPIFFST